jgi:hypothetical protein
MSSPADADRSAIDLALAWRSGRLASDPSLLRPAVARVMAAEPSSAGFGARTVLESVIRGIASELEALLSSPQAGSGPAKGAPLSPEQIRACCAAMAAGMPEAVALGRSRPPLRADLQRLLSRLARQSLPRSDFARRLLELDASVRAGAVGRVPPRPAADAAGTPFDLRSFRRHRFGRLA